jgi:hypothetical protein
MPITWNTEGPPVEKCRGEALKFDTTIISRYGKRANKKADLGFDGRKGHCKVPEAGVQ